MQLSSVMTVAGLPAADRRPIRGGSVAWACHPGFPPSTIFPYSRLVLPPDRTPSRAGS